MADITAAMVKDLRDRSGAGMMDCKAALKQTGGDVEAAVDWLRTKGLAKAAKKAGRTAADGLVALAISDDGKSGVAVEVNAETDFVARNELFQKMVANIAHVTFSVEGDVEKLKAAPYPGSDKTVEAYVAEMVGQIGENMSVRRAEAVSVADGVIVSYIHTPVCDGAGKIGVLVALETQGNTETLKGLGKQLAMHIAATRPLSLTLEELDPDVINREREILSEQARESGKPEAIIEKMVTGRIQKFYEESVLLEQTFVIDGETKINKVIENAKSDAGADVVLKGFVRLELGEGIEDTSEDDFASEVQALASGDA